MPQREISPRRIEQLRQLLDAPAPDADDPYVALRWINHWIELLRLLVGAWEHDREEARQRWLPEAAARVLLWPADRRPLPQTWFDSVASQKDDGRAEVFAPLFASFHMGIERRSVKFQPRRFERFFSHPIASSLRSLELCNTHLPPAMAALVARSPRLGGLAYLSFDRTRAGNEGVRSLAGATHFSALRELNLFSMGMDHEGLAALLDAPLVSRLDALHVGGNGLGVAGARVLGACPRLGSLKRLSLWVDSVDLPAALALLESPALGQLEELDLRQNPLDEAAQQRLAAARPGMRLRFQARPGPWGA
jgi:hypothetical protein